MGGSKTEVEQGLRASEQLRNHPLARQCPFPHSGHEGGSPAALSHPGTALWPLPLV